MAAATHTYIGPAYPATPSVHAGMVHGQSPEIIDGTFRCVSKGEGQMLLGDEGQPELFWIVRVPEVVGLRAVA